MATYIIEDSDGDEIARGESLHEVWLKVRTDCGPLSHQPQDESDFADALSEVECSLIIDGE